MAGEIIYPESFDDMSPGVVSLGVPTLRDVIQVNAAADGDTRLRVDKTEYDARIMREDGVPLQVHVRYSESISCPPWSKTLTTLVFETPVPVLELRRHPQIRDAWITGGEVPDRNVDAAAIFLSVIGQFARMKQERNGR